MSEPKAGVDEFNEWREQGRKRAEEHEMMQQQKFWDTVDVCSFCLFFLYICLCICLCICLLMCLNVCVFVYCLLFVFFALII